MTLTGVPATIRQPVSSICRILPPAAPPAEACGRQAQAHRPQELHPRDWSGYARNFGSEAASAGEGLHFLIKNHSSPQKKVRSPLGPLCEGAPPAGGGGENCTVAQNISGYGKVLSLRSPLWRKRHLPRIGGVCLAEGGFSTRRGEMWLTSLLFAVTGRWKVQPFLHHHRI